MLDKYKRYGHLPGKMVAGNLYFHMSMVFMLPEALSDRVLQDEKILRKHYPGCSVNIVKFNMNTDKISFIYSENFDTDPEPSLNMVYIMNDSLPPIIKNYNGRPKHTIPIYHHKWMFVSHHYKGFDVEESKKRSEWWQKHPIVIDYIKHNKYFKSKIGFLSFWNNVLADILEYDIFKKHRDSTGEDFGYRFCDEEC
jgi:hypothetical protein